MKVKKFPTKMRPGKKGSSGGTDDDLKERCRSLHCKELFNQTDNISSESQRVTVIRRLFPECGSWINLRGSAAKMDAKRKLFASSLGGGKTRKGKKGPKGTRKGTKGTKGTRRS